MHYKQVVEIKIFVISAGADPIVANKSDNYVCKFDEDYARRFIRHLKNNEGLCTACGEHCIKCRLNLVGDLSGNIAGHLRLPLVADQFIDDPEDCFPDELVDHDITIAINIHPDLLLEVPAIAKKAKSKALVVPVEDPDWLGGWVDGKLNNKCTELGLEFAAPKPFCSLTGDGYVYIKDFIEKFKVGRPDIDLVIEDESIKQAKVLISAPCGATYYLARLFNGSLANEKLLEIACKGLSSYPCTASTKVDPELNDSITHKANYIMMDVLKSKLKAL